MDEDLKAYLKQLVGGQKQMTDLLMQVIASNEDIRGAVGELIATTQELGIAVKEVLDAARAPDGGEDPFAKLEAAVQAVGSDVKEVGEGVRAIPDAVADAVEQVGRRPAV